MRAVGSAVERSGVHLGAAGDIFDLTDRTDRTDRSDWRLRMVRIKRAYEPPAPTDGRRVLVDRLWPRGLKKEDASLDDWAKALAPSDELRRWFAHEPAKFDEFAARYLAELSGEEARAKLRELERQAKTETVTLVFAAKDEAHNNAVVLRELLAKRGAKPSARRTARPAKKLVPH